MWYGLEIGLDILTILGSIPEAKDMKKGIKSLLIILGIGMVFVTTILVIRSINQWQVNRNLDDLFCQQLHLGMTVDEVRQVLNNFGEFEEFRYEHHGSYQLLVVFKDQAIKAKIGYYQVILNFDDKKGYTGPEIPYDMERKQVCFSGVSQK